MIVVDASVAVKWIVSEPGSEESTALIARTDLIAPDLVFVEAANALRKKAAIGDIAFEQIADGLKLIKDCAKIVPMTMTLTRRALAISQAMQHPVYDCIYIALAEREQGTLVTHDDQLKKRMSRHGFAWLLAEFPAP